VSIAGVDPRDAEWIASELKRAADPQDGLCFATFNDELLGPFACSADAEAAQNFRLAELEARGVDVLALNPRMAVIFADPARYHLPKQERLS
jgi:hypothetical protein